MSLDCGEKLDLPEEPTLDTGRTVLITANAPQYYTLPYCTTAASRGWREHPWKYEREDERGGGLKDIRGKEQWQSEEAREEDSNYRSEEHHHHFKW